MPIDDRDLNHEPEEPQRPSYADRMMEKYGLRPSAPEPQGEDEIPSDPVRSRESPPDPTRSQPQREQEVLQSILGAEERCVPPGGSNSSAPSPGKQ